MQPRNRQMPGARQETTSKVGDITLDLLSRQVWVGDRRIDRSAREFLLAEVFLRHPMQVLTREQLLDRVWVLNPKAQSLTVFAPDSLPKTYRGAHAIADPLLPELRLTVEQLFAIAA